MLIDNNENTLLNNDNVQTILCRLSGFGLVFSTLNGVMRFFTYKIIHNTLAGSYLMLFFWCFILGLSMLKLWKIIGNQIILSVFIYVCFITSMYLFFPLSKEWIIYYLNDLLIYMLVGIPMMIIISKVRNWTLLLDSVAPVFRLTAIFTSITYILSGGSFFTPMEWGNRVMPISLAYTAFFGYRKEKIDYVLLPLLIVFSLLGGRQSFAVVILGIMIVFFMSENTSFWILLIKISSIAVMSIVVVSLEQIANFAIALLADYGIRARSLEKLASGFLEDSGRTKIYAACIQIIKNNGIHLNGIFSDHYYVVQANVGKNYKFAHNFALEILIDFGVFLGGIILLWLLFILVRRVMDCKPQYRVLLYLFILYGMGRIAVSSSIFIYFNFVILMGFLFNDSIYNYRLRFVI